MSVPPPTITLRSAGAVPPILLPVPLITVIAPLRSNVSRPRRVRHAVSVRADEIARNRIVLAPVAQVLADVEGSGRNLVDDETLDRGPAGAIEMEQTPDPNGSPADLDLEHRVV